MFLTLGREFGIPEEKIIGIFDLDSSMQSRITRDFLSRVEKDGSLCNTADDIPISFLLCQEQKSSFVYLAQTSSRTLAGKLSTQELRSLNKEEDGETDEEPLCFVRLQEADR